MYFHRLVVCSFVVIGFLLVRAEAAVDSKSQRPNVLWLTCEDMGPHLGAYGDRYSATPNLDRFAARGLRYLNAWSNAPVCAPARTTLISGLYPTSTGSEHMRSMTRLPARMKMYPQFLREAGYYCTNNSKEDYNLEKPGEVWDDSSPKAHWKNRKAGQPFFAVFNFTITHESQIRRRPHQLVHDPAKVRLPAYHPDTPEVRHDWAQYYDNITEMDAQFGARLKELEEAGLAGDTIVFFYSDHGSGMPRSKRWPYNSGLNVPLIVHFPDKFRHLASKGYAPGATTDRLVSFVDFAPTLLSLAGIKPPDYLQGYSFMGQYEAPPQSHIYGFRGRMDERYDMVRSVRDKRYVYIRNYMPHRIYGQHVAYMFETPTTQAWKRLFDDGKLKPPQTYFWQVKPAEELYDLELDRDEVNNLAGSPQHHEILNRLRRAQQELALRIRDVGFLPEDEIHSRSEGSTPYEMGHDKQRYPLERILSAAGLAASLRPEGVEELRQKLGDKDSAVRYWAAMGILARGKSAVTAARGELHKALLDEAPSVRATASEALGRYGDEEDLNKSLRVLLDLATSSKKDLYGSIRALNALDELDGRAAPALQAIQELGRSEQAANPRTGEYVSRLVAKILADMQR
jgi:arylsulfatase A-like enzyme